MADTNSFDVVPSDLKTSPPLNATPVFRQRPATMGQVGRSTSYVSSGDDFSFVTKPRYQELATWDNARRKEPIIKDGIDKIVLSAISKIGDYEHPDNQISDFVNANITGRIQKWIGDLMVSAYWSGLGISENLWTKRVGPDSIPQIWVEDIVNYHPYPIDLRLNDHGRLTHGERMEGSQFLTGVWVPTPYNEKPKAPGPNYSGGMIRLPRSKVIHTSMGGEGNNPFGISSLTPVIEYHLFKEAFRDMMAVALDRYGTPLIYAIVPPQTTGEFEEGLDGTSRPVPYREVVARALENLRSETAIVLEQIGRDQPVQLGALTTGNNFADAFKEGIDMCDHNMMAGMGIPNLIVRDQRNSLGNGQAAETQVEMFHVFISAILGIVLNDFTEYLIKQLIAYNFDARIYKQASNPGKIATKPFRYTDTATLINSFVSLTEWGFLNPSNQEDFNHVRQLVLLPQRRVDNMTKKAIDSKFNKTAPATLSDKGNNNAT